MTRTGTGYDSHAFVKGRPLMLGGVEVPHEMGLKGHSDADALIHAIIDAILGAMGAGDIGKLFPDTDPAYRDAPSIELLKRVLGIAHAEGFNVAWVDATVICEAPRIGQHVPAMLKALEDAGLKHVNIKGKSNEGMGFIGRGEGIACMAVATVERC